MSIFIPQTAEEGAGAAPPSDFGFVFVVDVPNGAVAAALAKPVRRFDVRLLANGVAVPLKSAQLSAPFDTLGVQLSAELARPDVAQIPAGASVDFELATWAGGGFVWEKMFAGGRLSARTRQLVNADNLPADTVQVTFVDVLGDRWNLRPERQTFLYDPDKIESPPSTSSVGRGFTAPLYTLDGARVETISEAVENLSFYEVLRRAYVEGCGFDEVKTNVEDFPAEQVSFTLTGGYDAGVRPLLKPFSPVVFPVANDLWIIDPDEQLPAGLSALALTVSRLVEMTETLPAVEAFDGLIVTLKDEAGGDYFTERLEAPPAEPSGTFGTPGFTLTATQRRVREYRNFSDPATIIREETASLTTTTTDFEGNVISREILVDSFDALGRKNGHSRTLEQRLPDLNGGGALLLQTVSEETQNIFFGVHPLDASKETVEKVETRIDGLILVDAETEYLGQPYRIPLTDAHRSGYINPDGEQTTEFGAIKTIFETLRVRGRSVEMESRTINHITNAPDQNKVTTRPGGAEIERSRAATRQIVLLAEGATGRRRLEEFDGTALPPGIAMKLARRELKKLSEPPHNFAGALAFPDRRIRKGTLLDISDRAGEPLGRFITIGYTYTFTRENNSLSVKAAVQARQVTGQAGGEAAASLGATDSGGVPLNYVPVTAPEGGLSPVFVALVPCYAGRVLQAIADEGLTVEARRTASGDPFADIEAAPINLPPFDGAAVSFDFRIAAGNVSAVSPLQARIRVAYA